ncbi:hypothetical protein NKG94_31435 [Micromonospora sp. M12]
MLMEGLEALGLIWAPVLPRAEEPAPVRLSGPSEGRSWRAQVEGGQPDTGRGRRTVMPSRWKSPPDETVSASILATHSRDTWDRARRELAENWEVMLHARLVDWLPEQTDEASCGRCSGADGAATWSWSRGTGSPDRRHPGTAAAGRGAPDRRGRRGTRVELRPDRAALPLRLRVRRHQPQLHRRPDAGRGDDPWSDRGGGRAARPRPLPVWPEPAHLLPVRADLAGRGRRGGAQPQPRPAADAQGRVRQCDGVGAGFRPTDIGFGPDGRAVRTWRPDGTPAVGDEWTFRSFVLDGEYLVATAVYDADLESCRS